MIDNPKDSSLLRNVCKVEAWLSRDSILSLDTFPPLAGADDFSGLATFVDGNNLDLLAARGLL